jgi:hypothetical protein
MSDPSFVCATCGQRHSGLPTDYGFRLPDDVHELGYIEQYQRSRSNADLCTLDEQRYFFRGVIPVPFVGSDEEFYWGVWVEVEKEDHDAYIRGFDEDMSDHPRFVARLANDIPGYGGTKDLEVEVQFQSESARPSFHFPEAVSHPLAHEQREGITQKRHHDILEAVGFFEDGDS